MKRDLRAFAAAGPLLLACPPGPGIGAKSRAALSRSAISTARRACRCSRKSTAAVNRPMMSVFNNLVLYDQHVAQNSPKSIVPELATGWAWNEEGTELTMPLRQGVKWHDGKPFTAADVKCTCRAAAGHGDGKAADQPAQILVHQPQGGHDKGRLRGHLPPEAAAGVAAGDAGDRLDADLSLPRLAGADAAAPDRHRPLQIRRVQAEPIDHGGAATRITGSRAGPISTASSGRSSRTCRRGCSRSWRARRISTPPSRCRN